MPFVLDNSVAIGWYFENQATPYTDGVLKRMARDVAHAPPLWPLEFANVLRKAIAWSEPSDTIGVAAWATDAAMQPSSNRIFRMNLPTFLLSR